MKKTEIREIISTVFKALTLAMGLPLWRCPGWAVWTRKPLLPCLASALSAPAPPCWRNRNA